MNRRAFIAGLMASVAAPPAPRPSFKVVDYLTEESAWFVKTDAELSPSTMWLARSMRQSQLIAQAEVARRYFGEP